MGLSKIRWKEADYKRLHQAVNKFNKTLKSVGDLDTKPELIDYQDLKHSIMTRKGLDDSIKALNRITKQNAENVVTTDTGLRISEYEWNEIKRADKINKIRLGKEYKKLSTPLSGESYSRVQMGTSRARQVEANLRRDNMKRLMEARDTTQFNEIANSIMNKASEDIRYQRTLQYQQNYLDILRTRYSGFKNYDMLMEKVEKMTPAEFFKFMQKNELTEDLTYQSDQYYSEAEFNDFLTQLDLIPDMSIEVTEGI